MRLLIYGALALAFLSTPALAEPPATFAEAKVVARDVIYAGHAVTIYCGCAYTPRGRSGGDIDAASCGIAPRADAARAMRLEWEHAAPAAWFGRLRACWTQGDPRCVDGKGRAYKGRKCCSKVDADFQRAEADLRNLFPSAGEPNGDRSDRPYGVIPGEPRAYGACDFEVSRDTAEPPEAVRGDLARAVLYMDGKYGPFLTDDQRALYAGWSEADPPDEWELERERRIEAVER
jgi:deoxyribonuclease-1